MTQAPDPVVKPPRRRFGPKGPIGWILPGLFFVAVLLAAGGVGLRYYVKTDSGRNFIVSRLTGLKLGPIGKLHVDGLTGDVLTDFSVAHLTISDQTGVWLEARKAHVVWDYRQLIHRLFVANVIGIEDVKVYRRPVLIAPQPNRVMPVSVDLKRLTVHLES